jgi:hypothetical protein
VRKSRRRALPVSDRCLLPWFCVSEGLQDGCLVFSLSSTISVDLPLPSPAPLSLKQIPMHSSRLKVTGKPFLFGQKERRLLSPFFVFPDNLGNIPPLVRRSCRKHREVCLHTGPQIVIGKSV